MDHLQNCQNYRIINLFSHQSKVTFKVVNNRTSIIPEEPLAED